MQITFTTLVRYDCIDQKKEFVTRDIEFCKMVLYRLKNEITTLKFSYTPDETMARLLKWCIEHNCKPEQLIIEG